MFAGRVYIGWNFYIFYRKITSCFVLWLCFSSANWQWFSCTSFPRYICFPALCYRFGYLPQLSSWTLTNAWPFLTAWKKPRRLFFQSKVRSFIYTWDVQKEVKSHFSFISIKWPVLLRRNRCWPVAFPEEVGNAIKLLCYSTLMESLLLLHNSARFTLITAGKLRFKCGNSLCKLLCRFVGALLTVLDASINII